MSQNENKSVEKADGKGILDSVGSVADHVVGDMVLGSIGRVGRHLNDIPVVGQTGRYIGENVADGYRAEDLSIRIRKLVKEFVEKGRTGQMGLEPATLRAALIKEGVAEANLDGIVEQAEVKAFGKESQAEEAGPAAPAAVPA